MYGHVAIYDGTTNHIFLHGGMAFYLEDVRLSNRMYAFDLTSYTWHYLENNENEQVTCSCTPLSSLLRNFGKEGVIWKRRMKIVKSFTAIKFD